MKNKAIYVRIDADDVGNQIEISLYREDFITANGIHERIQNGIKEVCEMICEVSGTKILMVGSDDVLFSSSYSLVEDDTLNQIKKYFKSLTGFSLSIGVGYTVNQAMQNLNFAKLTGKDKIVVFDEILKFS